MKKRFCVLLLVLTAAMLFAGCRENRLITIKFDSNGGTECASIVTNGVSQITYPEDPTREGAYSFQGWFWDNNTFEKPFTLESVLKQPLGKNRSLTVYAKWRQADEYSIIFDSRGGSYVSPIRAFAGEEITKPADPVKSSYTLRCWKNEGIEFAFTTMPNHDIYLTADWVPVRYSITYRNLQGAHNNNPSTYTVEDYIIFNSPFKEGYVATWDKPEIQKGSTGNVTVTAGWTPKRYTIYFANMQDGTNPNSVYEYTIESETIDLQPPIRNGYVGAWDVVQIPAGSTGDKTITAVWTGNTYSVSFDAQGGNVTPKPLTVVFGSSGTFPTLTRTGYHFNGWFSEPGGTGRNLAYADGSYPSWSEAQDTAAYAYWINNVYTVTLDAGEGQVFLPSYNVTYDNNYDLHAAYSRSGYTFGGWYSERNGGGTQYTNESGNSLSVWKELQDKTLYAKWTANIYTLTLHPNGGKALDPGTVKVTFDSHYTLPIAERLGYTFDGWSDTSNGNYRYTDPNGKSLTVWNTSSDETVVARWVSKVYTVNLNMQGGTGETSSINVSSGSDMPEAFAPTRAGYRFVGYFDAQTAGKQYYGSSMNSLRVWDNETDTLYARWISEFSSLGTESSPHIVRTPDELIYFLQTETKDKHIQLGANIDLLGAEWIPAVEFKGSFDGKGFTISNFNITAAYQNSGLFSINSIDGTIQNLGVTNFKIDVVGYSLIDTVGGLAGRNYGLIFNCYTSGSVSAADAQSHVTFGGFVGSNHGTIVNSYSATDVVETTGKQYAPHAGGFAGDNSGKIFKCYSTGRVFVKTGSNSLDLGGFVGWNRSGAIVEDSFATGDVSGTMLDDHPSWNYYISVGGFIGSKDSTANFSNCYRGSEQVVESVRGSSVSGGSNSFGTEAAQSNLTNADWIKNTLEWAIESQIWTFDIGKYPVHNFEVITENAFVEISTAKQLRDLQGQILTLRYRLTANIVYDGKNFVPIAANINLFDGNGFTISDLKSTYSTQYSGLFGQNMGTIKDLGVKNASFNVINSSGTLYAGVFCGFNLGTIENCFATGTLTAQSSDFVYAGGFSGFNNNARNCYASVDVTASAIEKNTAFAGGFNGANAGTIENCFASGNVSAASTNNSPYAGGFSGMNGGTIVNCLALGNVSASVQSYASSALAGGVAASSNTDSLVNCYRFEYQEFRRIVNGKVQTAPSNDLGIKCSYNQLDTAQFYAEKLGWSSEIWDFTNLDCEGGILPKLKRFA